MVPGTQSVGRSFEQQIDQQQSWLDPLADRLQHALTTALTARGRSSRRVKDALNGIWLGHPLHPALTDLPIGAWTTAAFLDLAGSRRGASVALLAGVVAAMPTALSGLADWHDTSGRPRRVGLVHALLNSAALGCYLASLRARANGSYGRGMLLSTLGMALVTVSAYLGGELVYRYGLSVDRNAWRPAVSEFQVVARASDLPEGQLVGREIELDGQRVPVVLLRKDGRVFAIGGVCAHMGGPLAEGRVVDEYCVECPWHGSRFDLRDGTVVQGPSAFSQPCYETRERDGMIEVRQRF